jgi:hypothetical protein
MRELIRNDEKYKVQEQLEALLLDGLSGGMTPLTADDFKNIRQKALAIIEARKAGR